jgi:hypothetical protein
LMIVYNDFAPGYEDSEPPGPPLWPLWALLGMAVTVLGLAMYGAKCLLWGCG